MRLLLQRIKQITEGNPKVKQNLLPPALVFLCALLYFSRCPYTTLHPSLYAEDGSIFLQSAIDHGLGSIFELYAGYSHLLQRVTALLAVKIFSPLLYPIFFLIIAWTSYILPLITSEALICSGTCRPILRIAYIPYVYYPNATETYLNLPNSYIFFPLSFILLAYAETAKRLNEPSRNLPRETSILKSTILLLYGSISALTGPFLAIYTLPMLILQAIKIKKIPAAPLWLSIPATLSLLQIYFSQFSTKYPVTTMEAFIKILQNPELIVQWGTFNLASPLLGGQNTVNVLKNINNEARIVFLLIVLGLIIMSTKKVFRSIEQSAIIKLAILSTTALSLSSLVVSLKRGYDLKIVAGYDAGGRFFIWNTLLFTSILLIAFAINTQRFGPWRSWSSKILTTWLLISVITFTNQIGPRVTKQTYVQQINEQCEIGRPNKIQIWPGPQWAFELSKPLLSQACVS